MTHPLTAQVTDQQLADLYGPSAAEAETARNRIDSLATFFHKATGDEPTSLYTAAGRTEMGGNHTDHQHGNVLASSVNWDALAVAAPTTDTTIRVISAQYPEDIIQVGDWEQRPEEEGTSIALVRGICRALADRGYEVGGVTIATHSNVPGGSGLSSSAAFEVLIGNVLNHLFADDQLDAVQLAQIGQFAENVYMGKPSGLLDQMASSVGGVIAIDFGDPTRPVVEAINLDVTHTGYVMCMIDSGADHADLTEDYSAITQEMGAVASYFGASHLRDVDPADFWADLAAVRAATGDRAVLRAMHFFGEDERVPRQVQALAHGDFEGFLHLVEQSGRSSATLLQNIYSDSTPTNQAIGVTIALAQHLLKGKGAVRVHGGGFAGVVQAYVPEEDVKEFKQDVDAALGEGACEVVLLRPVGGAVLVG